MRKIVASIVVALSILLSGCLSETGSFGSEQYALERCVGYTTTVEMRYVDFGWEDMIAIQLVSSTNKSLSCSLCLLPYSCSMVNLDYAHKTGTVVFQRDESRNEWDYECYETGTPESCYRNVGMLE